ncbi:MAG TPA: hypothetical protein PLQ76_02040, partial [bacterium]|nr:hypothetical protein [bacterium]
HERGPDRILFAANPIGETKNTSIGVGDKETLSDIDTGELFAGPAAKITLPGYSVKVFHLLGGCSRE